MTNTVQYEISRITGNIADTYTAASGKGATIPATQDSDNLATCIASIPSGGSSPVITSLSITPTTSAQTITAPSGTDGYSPISVAAVTSSIDSNISAGNIKKDVTILGVVGSYEGSGGGGGSSHEKLIKANYYIDSSGVVHNFEDNSGNTIDAKATTITTLLKNYANDATIREVDLSALTAVGADTVLYSRFSSSGITKLDLSSLESVSNQSAIAQICRNSTSLTEVDLHSLETVSGKDAFNYAFNGCTSLINIDLSSLKTVSGEGAFYFAFSGCSITKLDLSSLETLSGKNAMYYLVGDFSVNNNTLTEVDLSGLKEVSGEGALMGAFLKCNSLSTVKWPTTSINVTGKMAFQQAFKGTNLSGVLDLSWISSISGMYGIYMMFGVDTAKVSGITRVDLTGLTSISGMYACLGIFNNLTDVTASIIDISNLETVTGTYGFAGLSPRASGTYTFPKLSNINGSNVLSGAFQDASSGLSISFPALTSTSFGSYTNQFNNMLYDGFTTPVDGCTVHFPSNLQSVIGSWSDVTGGFGGTNTTVLFDLPATS